jgi:hypothetical protein
MAIYDDAISKHSNMKTKKLNQYGSHLISVVLVVCFVSLAVFVGYKIIAGHKVAVDTKTEAETPANTTQTIQVPEGWKLFTDKDIGIQFVYPAGAGAFVKPAQSEAVFESSQTSGRYSAITPGVDGSFTIGSYKSATAEVSSRRYGPMVKLDGGQWIVTEPNQYDPTTYHKGDVYPEMTHVNTKGIDVYTATSGDEGVVRYNLFFASHGKLRELELPPFDSGVYSSSYNINDQGPYDSMYTQIRDSISLY